MRAYHEPECSVATAYDHCLWFNDLTTNPVKRNEWATKEALATFTEEERRQLREAFEEHRDA